MPSPLFDVPRAERGVKNLRKDLGVTGGGRLGLRELSTSDIIDGGEEGKYWDDEKMGSGSDSG